MPTFTTHHSLGASLRTAAPALSAFLAARFPSCAGPVALAGALLVRRPERPELHGRRPLARLLPTARAGTELRSRYRPRRFGRGSF
eukprot:829001-Alexandrium_andersonii.AAC.1